MSLQFTPVAGSTMQASTLDSSVEAPFSSWYQSTTSRGFGSQFTAAVTIAVTGDSADVQSVAVRLSNEMGSSSTVTANLR
jgi:hypothetical protein